MLESVTNKKFAHWQGQAWLPAV